MQRGWNNQAGILGNNRYHISPESVFLSNIDENITHFCNAFSGVDWFYLILSIHICTILFEKAANLMMTLQSCTMQGRLPILRKQRKHACVLRKTAFQKS